ncbi:hypothetical protein OG339_48825 (plasmid) [Streptosporangium sp. NBC_01495]|uniref:hypothetical protein n=1 Tax=Streptosporangium sp. NBC_01495 TaxID=2903899 RepID=UPI002E35761C|nr:hypothetical protein [Streptosporangium sp. NBC_01495]
MAGKTPIKMWIDTTTEEALRQRLATEQVKLGEVLADPRWAITWGMLTNERAQVRADQRAHLADLREGGDLLDKLTVLMTYAVRCELERREWRRRWPPVPATAPKAGRWPGSPDEGWTKKVSTSIPADLAQQVHAGCWHTSKDAIKALRRWRDKNPGIITRSNAPHLQEQYDELVKKVTTPGKVWRAALAALLGPARESH